MLEGPELDADYWYASLRATVEFDRAIRALAESDHQVFIETSPHPVLTGAITDTLQDTEAIAPIVTGTLRRDEGGPARLLTSLAEALRQGRPRRLVRGPRTRRARRAADLRLPAPALLAGALRLA